MAKHLVFYVDVQGILEEDAAAFIASKQREYMKLIRDQGDMTTIVIVVPHTTSVVSA